MDEPDEFKPSNTGYQDVVERILITPMATDVRTKKLMLHNMKYEARSRLGDIVEVRKNHNLKGSKEHLSFAFISVPDMSLGEGKKYGQSHLNGETLLHKHLYWVDISTIILNAKKEATLNKADFLSRVRAKK